MDSIAWWPTILLVVMASIADLHNRRIPNWLVVPGLAAGLVVSAARYGLHGFGQSLSGAALAVLATGVFVWLKGMGMGDLKLLAAVGAWIGPSQLVIALVVTGLAGGAMALLWAVCRGSLGKSLDSVTDLVTGVWRRDGFHRPEITSGSATALKIPYAPAIAIGSVFSFFTR